ncbi:MAG: hypothetical protein U0230_10225 [Polyangiales bacterium]
MSRRPLLFAFFSAFLFVAACGSESTTPPPVCTGASCSCNSGGSCAFTPNTCGGDAGSCTLNCNAQTTCSGECGASCSFSCASGSTCDVTVGPSASVDCTGNSTCHIACTGSCSMSCSTGSTCLLRCAGQSTAQTITSTGSCP